MNIPHVMYLYNKIKEHPDMEFYPRTFIFGAKAAAGYKRAKLTIKLINSVADVINNDASIEGKAESRVYRRLPCKQCGMDFRSGGMYQNRSQQPARKRPVPVI